MLEPRAVSDHYACAVRAQDLTVYHGSSFAPSDVLAAAGMAAQRQGLGMLLQRLRADATPAVRVEAEVALVARLKDAVRRRLVRRGGFTCEAIVRQALSWWLDPTCLSCRGVRFTRVPGSNRLTLRCCSGCNGSGHRALAAPAPAAAEWVLSLVDQVVANSEAAHRKALR